MKRYINLLPPEHQKQNQLERVSTQVFSFGALIAVSLLVLAGILFGYDLFLKTRLERVEGGVAVKTSEVERLKKEALREDLASINQDLDNFKVLFGLHQDWSPALQEFVSILPAGMTLDNMVISREDLRVDVSGRAASRDLVLDLRARLLESEYFKNVNFPLSNLEKRNDVKWKFRFYLKPEKLR